MAKWIKGVKCPECGHVEKKGHAMSRNELCPTCGAFVPWLVPGAMRLNSGRPIDCSIRRRWPWGRWESRPWPERAT